MASEAVNEYWKKYYLVREYLNGNSEPFRQQYGRIPNDSELQMRRADVVREAEACGADTAVQGEGDGRKPAAPDKDQEIQHLMNMNAEKERALKDKDQQIRQLRIATAVVAALAVGLAAVLVRKGRNI